jgi:hypothetical protein
MPQQIDVPGMGIVEFPDGMSDADITAAIQKNMPKQEAGSSVGGFAKSLGVGAAEGLIGLAGILGDVSMIGVPNNPESPYGSAAIKKGIERHTGDFYKPQGRTEQFANTVGQFLPAVVGGPETLAMKLASRVAVPAAASEAAGALTGDNPYAKLAGGLGGGFAGIAGARKYQEMLAARRAVNPVPATEDILKAAKGQFKQAEDMNLVTTSDFAADAAAKMRSDIRGFDPEAQGAVFKAADRLAGLVPPIQAKARNVASALDQPVLGQATKSGDEPLSLLQFIAAKGGLLPDGELEAIGLARGHRAQIPGQSGFFGVVSNKGQNIDRIREAAEEAGYLRGANNATSTPRDLLDAIDAELRGQKRFPMGFEGSKTKRESAFMSEREKHAFDSHVRGFEDALAQAGHGQVSPDVKKRAIQLMEREGMDADTAVEHALLQLDHEDAIKAVAKPAFAHGFPPDMAKGVAMNDVELIRKQLTTLKTSPDASVREAARRAISSLQESQISLTPAQVINGDAGVYSKTMKDAIGNWAAGKRSNTVMGKAALGELNAATAGSGANEDNALRQAMKQLARPINNDITPKWQRLGFNKQEGAAIERVARGSFGGNAARYLGKLAPTGSVSGVLGAGAGYGAAGPLGAVALPAVGYLAKKIGDMSTKQAVAAVDKLVRSRSPLAAQVAAQLPPQVIQQLPRNSQRLLQGLILADPVLRQQPRQAVGQPAAQ